MKPDDVVRVGDLPVGSLVFLGDVEYTIAKVGPDLAISYSSAGRRMKINSTLPARVLYIDDTDGEGRIHVSLMG